MTEPETPIPCTWCGATGKRLVRHNKTGERHGMTCACQVTDLPVPFIYQPEEFGCGVAAIAMATRNTYEDVRRRVVMSNDLSGRSHAGGLDVGQLDDLLDHLGFAWRARSQHVYRLHAQREVWPCEPFADTHVAFVRNLSDTNNHFAVLLRDGRVLDPWWGVIQGLHRYPKVFSVKGLYRVEGLA